jgi:TPR repeat protein
MREYRINYAIGFYDNKTLEKKLKTKKENILTDKLKMEDLLEFAKSGEASFQFDLGVIYRNGDGTPKNFEEAMKWFLKAANQGHSGAAAQLGQMYRLGEGTPKDLNESAKWLRLAHEQGDKIAVITMTFMYIKGQLTPKDLKEEEMLKRLAKGLKLP